MSRAHRLVIIGTGMAGARLAEHVLARTAARPFELVMFGEEPGGTYNRILLSGVLAGTHAGPDIVTNPVDWYDASGIVLHSEAAVAVDLVNRQVAGARGTEVRFDSLVFATGSSPVVPAIDGLARPDGSMPDRAFVFRTVDDCARIAVAASEGRKAVVIGGGLLGLEAARGLIGHGLDVSVVHLAGHVMDSQLDRDGGRVLQRQLERLGLRVLPGKTTARVHADTAVQGLEFSDGTRMDCDLLVIAAGVRPNVQLARSCGLRVQRGIVVGDDLACTGAPAVYALGDCAEHRGQVYGLVAPAWEQADVLADRLTGREPAATYTGSRLATKLKVAGIHVAVMGDRDPLDDDEVVSYTEPARGIYSRVIVRGDRVAGAMLIGAPEAVPSVVQRFLDRSQVPEQRSDLLFPPSGNGAATAVEAIPDAARICDCNAVAKAQIVDAVLNGARSLHAVCEKTRAGTGCGSCKPEVQRIVDFVCRDLVDNPVAVGDATAHSRPRTGGDHAPA
ncbi:MAG TPA: FAD-dependent oxidoreductase [Vicinamibacterales bacterium]|nr:FAD-dependent oxidoreductase [Vicinamibacterales bacterium]